MAEGLSRAGTGDIPTNVGIARRDGPERVFNGADKDPGGDAGQGEFETPGDGGSEALECIYGEGIGEQRADEMRGIERGLTGERLRIDGEPWLALRAEDIAQVEVAVGKDLGAVILREMVRDFDSAMKKRFGEWATGGLVSGGKCFGIAAGQGGDEAERMRPGQLDLQAF